MRTGRSPLRARLAAVAAGILADRLLGEPPAKLHPVAAFGRLMVVVEGLTYADRRAAGVAHLGVGLGVAAGPALLARRLAAGPAWLVLAAATYVAGAGRALGLAASDVAAPLAEGDLLAARARLGALVGRDPNDLDQAEIARAVVESLAENTVDAIVAPALWGAAGGALGALSYRALNTLDAMVGHRCTRYRRFGWSSARADDVANWVPARATAVLVAGLRPHRARAVWRAVRFDAPAHPSPNAGVAEAAFAAALGLRLGGTNSYGGHLDHRGSLGSGRPAGSADIRRAQGLSRDVSLALVVALLVAAVTRRAP
ncbi:MAG: adenosylcobinamide-phosphate synthase CbiB [Acidimicrobiales bacterium]